MRPKVFLYKEYDKSFELYIGNLSTIEGLLQFEGTDKILLKAFGATNYKAFGWATQQDMPKFETISDLVMFFENENDIGLIEFELKFTNGDKFSSHDDGECKMILSSKEKIFDVIRNVSPLLYQDKILSTLIQNQNKYISIDKNGNVQVFFTFEDYVKNGIL